MEPHVAAKILIEQCDALMTYFMAPIHHDLLSRYIENDFIFIITVNDMPKGYQVLVINIELHP